MGQNDDPLPENKLNIFNMLNIEKIACFDLS